MKRNLSHFQDILTADLPGIDAIADDESKLPNIPAKKPSTDNKDCNADNALEKLTQFVETKLSVKDKDTEK